MPMTEARRIMTLCNVCTYCNGYCEVFRAAERRRDFSDADLTYLANLCHNCRNCRHACQYAPPHVFAVNVPGTLALVRDQSYRDYSWPLPRRSAGRAAAAIAVLLIPILMSAIPWETVFSPHAGPGAFYEIVPRSAMMLAAVLSLGWSFLCLGVGLIRFWRDTGGGDASASVPGALRDILTLRNLDGGGAGCHDPDQPALRWRRCFHHAVFYGFALCFASTVAATFYHYVLGGLAPYPAISPPVLLGGAGGVAMVVGTAGLAWIKKNSDSVLDAERNDYSFLGLLFAVSVTGLALMIFRESAAMGILLLVHLGCVFGFLATLAHGKFVHGPFRAAAVLRAAMERKL